MNAYQRHELQKDSFSDRMCDDLCEVLLSYLSFEHKIRFESISKQWKRCVYNKQYILEVIEREDENSKNKLNKLLINGETERKISLEALESVLKKCKFINKIIMYYKWNETANEVMQIISKNCKHLKSIEFDFNNLSEETLKYFGKSCGDKLEKIEFLKGDFNKNYKILLNSCPNMLSLSAVKLSDLIESDKKVFRTKLIKISLICLTTEAHLLETFFSQYKNTVKRFGIVCGLNNSLDENTINILMQNISRLEKLEELYLEFNFMKGFNLSFTESMKNFANNCPKIKRFSIHSLINNSLFGSEIFKSIKFFTSLKYLNLNIYHTLCNCGDEEIAVESLKDCKQLNNLVLNYPKLNDNFFVDIDLYLPKLKFLCIYTNNITDKTMHSLSKLKNVEVMQFNSLRLNLNFTSVTDIGIRDILINCSKIRSIRFNRRPNITHQTIDHLIGIALKNPHIYYSHSFGSFENESYEELNEMFFNKYKSLPNNIEIKS